MPNADTIEEVEVIDMTEFEFEAELPCDFIDCEEQAVSSLVCGICATGRELMCIGHTAWTADNKEQNPTERVIFTETCGHEPFFGTCEIVPL